MSEVDINYLKQVYRNRRIRYVIQEAKFSLNGEKESKIICVKGSEYDLHELLWRLKLAVKKIGYEVVFLDDKDAEMSKKAVYVYYTSKMPKEFDRKLKPINPIIVIEERPFEGECERVEIK